MEKKKQFKIVFLPDTNTYELWINAINDGWGLSHTFKTSTNDGNITDSEQVLWGTVSEQILWEMDRLNFLGYEFIGIERAMPSIDNI